MLNKSVFGVGTLSISPNITPTLFQCTRINRSKRRTSLISASQGSFSRSRHPTASAAAASAPTTTPPSIEAAKQLTKRIKAATNPADLFDLLEAQQDITSVRHLSIALHHLSKMQPLSMKNKKLKHHPDIIWIVKEILKRKDEQWEDISIANILEACHTLRLGIDFPNLLEKAEAELVKHREKPSNWRTVTSLMTALAKLGRKMDTHPYLQAVQASLLEKKPPPTNENENQNEKNLVIKIKLEDFEDYWGLAWALTELECSSRLADGVVSHVSTHVGFKNLSPRQLIFITRLAAERGSSYRALPTAQHIATALTCGRWEGALKSPTPRISARDLAMLFFNLAKLVRMAASTDLNSEIDPAMWHKMEQRVAQIDGSTPDLQNAIRLLQRALAPLVETMEAHEISSVVSALAQMQRTKSTLIPLLTARATLLAPTMDSTGLCMIARSLASLQFDSEAFIETAALALRKHLLSSPPMANATPSKGFSSGTGNQKKRFLNAPPSPSIQGLIAMLYSLAVLDRCDGPAVQRLLPELIPRLIPALAELIPTESNYLALVGWSLMVAKGPPRRTSTSTANESRARESILQALRAWRSAITRAGHRIPPRQLAMVQHVDVALRIECPDLGTDAPAQYDAFFNSLYDSGRLRFRAGAEWAAQKDRVLDNGTGRGGTISNSSTNSGSSTISGSSTSSGSLSSIDADTTDTDSDMDNNKYGYQKNGSRFQREVFSTLCQTLVPPPPLSSSFSTSWEFEYWEQNLWYPVDAALPAYKLAIEADGPTHYSTNTLRPLGHTLLKRRLLKQLGWVVVNIPLFEWVDVGGAEEKKEYLVEKVENALGNGMNIEEFLKTPAARVVEEEEEEKQESLLEVMGEENPENVGEDAVPAVDAAALANRALRLDLIKVRQGKLSKSQLAYNEARRKTSVANSGGTTTNAPLPSSSIDENDEQ